MKKKMMMMLAVAILLVGPLFTDETSPSTITYQVDGHDGTTTASVTYITYSTPYDNPKDVAMIQEVVGETVELPWSATVTFVPEPGHVYQLSVSAINTTEPGSLAVTVLENGDIVEHFEGVRKKTRFGTEYSVASSEHELYY